MKDIPKLAIDSVVMLTWSDWHTEPRSNRYHYATRFARHWPVYFVQPDGEGDTVTFEPVEGHDITIVHIAPDYGPAQSARLAAALHGRNVANPLIWIYNAFLSQACGRLNPRLTVFHATEDYVAPDLELQALTIDIRKDIKAALARCDLVVAVSDGVAESYLRHTGYRGPIRVLPNGCDFLFWEKTGASEFVAPPDGAKVALFQGGINGRLDYALLTELARRLPDWQFWFCGKSVDGGKAWADLQKLPNIRNFGLLSSEGIADLARQSRIGLIPFKQDGLMRRSLPLKAYEYLACGLPVVTIPIDALTAQPGLFAIAETAEAFAREMEQLAPSRTDPAQIAVRMEAARLVSYDNRFTELLSLLSENRELRSRARPPLNVLILYDDGSAHVGTIYEHLDAFRKYSEHRFFYMPATGIFPNHDEEQVSFDFGIYDAVIVHYSVRLSVDEHLAAPIAEAMKAYRGPKLLFIQDEYDRTERARLWIEELGISAVFTNVPRESLSLVYPEARFASVDFLPTLTGYVPEDPCLDRFAIPMAERHCLIAYRGRSLPHKYGALGYEKFRIGIDMKRICAERSLAADIDVTEESRIYGEDWYRFIGSARATLGTESGSNVFDFDGELARLSRVHADMAFPDFAARYLEPHEGMVRMNQVSPKIFEAIRLRTALLLFEGDYSGVVRPGEHFIALKKDYSNVDAVLDQLQDIPFLEAMTERAYRDVIDSGRYSYRTFIEGVDAYLSKAAMGRKRVTIISMPMIAIYDGNDAVSLWTDSSRGALLSDTILNPRLTRSQVVALAERLMPKSQWLTESVAQGVADATAATTSAAYRAVRQLWHMLPLSLRLGLVRNVRALAHRASDKDSATTRMLRPLWRLIPKGVRYRIVSRLR
jgi:glycosyltransferase involved in cell wall biosynthesis